MSTSSIIVASNQGDPLSPMLFILVMDVLNSCELGCSCGSAATSFYADDVVMFLRPAANDLTNIRQLLDIFGHASGLVTNMSKSSLPQFSARMKIWRSYPAVYLVILSTSLAPIWVSHSRSRSLPRQTPTLLLIRLLTISLDERHHP